MENIIIPLFITILLFIFVFSVFYCISNYSTNANMNSITNPNINNNNMNNYQQNIPNQNAFIPDQNINSSPSMVPIIYDKNMINENAIYDYDVNKAFNPMSDPARRPNVDQLPPSYFKDMIYQNSRGFDDEFRQLGVLVNMCDRCREDNQIIRLFGRREYKNSNKYEYYVVLDNGIKLPIKRRHKNKELYDGDLVFIKELGSEYKVSLYDMDSPRYYPDLI